MSQIPNNLGGAASNAIQKALNNASKSLSVADAGSFESFLNRWIPILSTHARKLRSEGNPFIGPVTIIHVLDSAAEGNRLSWERKSFLGTNSSDELSGLLAVVTEIGGYANRTKFIKFDQLESEIRLSKLCSYPALMLSDLNHLFLWPNGIDSSDCIEIELHDDYEIDEHKIDRLLQSFYDHRAKQGLYWWKDASKFITAENPEKLVQLDLWAFMLQLAETARVVIEAPVDSGRADVTIRPRSPSVNSKSCVLELKTIRSFHTPTTSKPATKIADSQNESWACSGVQQAAAYRDAESLDLAFLCVYDFRKLNDPDIDLEIQKNATLYNVFNRRYWISSTHKAYRASAYPLV